MSYIISWQWRNRWVVAALYDVWLYDVGDYSNFDPGGGGSILRLHDIILIEEEIPWWGEGVAIGGYFFVWLVIILHELVDSRYQQVRKMFCYCSITGNRQQVLVEFWRFDGATLRDGQVTFKKFCWIYRIRRWKMSVDNESNIKTYRLIFMEKNKHRSFPVNIGMSNPHMK